MHAVFPRFSRVSLRKKTTEKELKSWFSSENEK